LVHAHGVPEKKKHVYSRKNKNLEKSRISIYEENPNLFLQCVSKKKVIFGESKMAFIFERVRKNSLFLKHIAQCDSKKSNLFFYYFLKRNSGNNFGFLIFFLYRYIFRGNKIRIFSAKSDVFGFFFDNFSRAYKRKSVQTSKIGFSKHKMYSVHVTCTCTCYMFKNGPPYEIWLHRKVCPCRLNMMVSIGKYCW